MSVSEKKKIGVGGRREASSFHLHTLEPIVSNVEITLHVDGGYCMATETGNGTQGPLYSHFYSRRVDTTWQSAHWLTWNLVQDRQEASSACSSRLPSTVTGPGVPAGCLCLSGT